MVSSCMVILAQDEIQRILKFCAVSLFAILGSLNRINICIAYKIKHVTTLAEKIDGISCI